MNTGFYRDSAKIYAFPAKLRTRTGALREAVKPANDVTTERFAEEVLSGSWYHEAAVRESDSARKP